MKKYVLIQNEGVIESNSFELIGASSKRGDNSKIGFFGSGLKYSIAYMMRKGIDFRVFAGEHEMIFSTVSAKLRDQNFEKICIDGRETSFTTTMGATWDRDWFVLREVYCNALDESGCMMVRSTENVSGTANMTRIYIQLTEDLMEVVNNWDHYFSEDRTPVYEFKPVYTAHLGSAGSDGKAQQGVRVFPGTAGIIYRRGIQVSQNKKRLFDYDFDYVSINEDRTAKNAEALSYAVTNMFATFQHEGYIKAVLRSGMQEAASYEYDSLHSSNVYSPISEDWVQFAAQHLLVIKEMSGRYADMISMNKSEVFLIPISFARALKNKFPEIRMIGMDREINGVSFEEVKSTPRMDYLLKQVTEALHEMNYRVAYPVEIVAFTNNKTQSYLDVDRKIILLSETLFDLGRRAIACTLMQQNEKMTFELVDDDGEFSTHIVQKWITNMENSTGVFL